MTLHDIKPGSVIRWNDGTPLKPKHITGLVVGLVTHYGRECLSVEVLTKQGNTKRLRRVYETHRPQLKEQYDVLPTTV